MPASNSHKVSFSISESDSSTVSDKLAPVVYYGSAFPNTETVLGDSIAPIPIYGRSLYMKSLTGFQGIVAQCQG